MTPDDPRHGTPTGAGLHRRNGEPVCDPCLAAERRYRKRRRYDRAHGIYRRVDTALVAKHVQRLHADGLTYRQIARLADVEPTSVYQLLRGRAAYLQHTTAARLLAVRPGQMPVHGWVDVTGARRRLQALVAIGWTQAALADRLNISASHIQHYLHGDAPTVHVDRHNQVAALYRELHMLPGPSKRARTTAARHGWAPPLAWDNIDDPDERPTRGAKQPRTRDEVDESIVERLLAGERIKCTKSEKVEAFRRWVAMGRSAKSLADMHGWKAERYHKQTEAA